MTVQVDPWTAASTSQFFIPAMESLSERRPRTLKHGDTFGVFDSVGDVAGSGSPEGLFHRDTRHLSQLFLSVGGARPLLLGSILRDDNATLTCDLTNPDLYDADGAIGLHHDLLHIRRSRFLFEGACHERLVVKNYDDAPRTVALTIAFAADFADLFEVRGTVRGHHGERLVPVVGRDSVRLGYLGLDGRRRDTLLRFDPQPRSIGPDHATFEFSLAPRQACAAFVEIRCNAGEANPPVRRAFFSALRLSRQILRARAGRAVSVSTSNPLFDEGLRRAASDIQMLVTDTPDGPYPYAGIPWFSTVFGRDALITAFEMLWFDPAIARGVLRHLAANQATVVDAAADCEPGKILHEVRYGEMAELGEVPFRRYYGSIDSTPLFLMLAGAYLDRSGDVDTLDQLWPSLEAAMGWIDVHGDRDGDGFVEYGRRTAQGLLNQGWKDSFDSIFHRDGRLAEGPIALVEVQAYVYGALRALGRIAARLGRTARVAELDARAEDLRRRFDEAFFDADLGTYVLALDGDKRPCRAVSSNAGHALFAGIAYPARAGAVAASLMGPAMWSGWGIRTVATDEARYNPMSYHNGSVWPHDNAMVALGLARYGYRREAARVFSGLFEASVHFDLRRLPELFCGFPRQRGQGPTSYPVACSPQAWAAAAPLALLQACLGLDFVPGDRRVGFDGPVLPDFIDEVTLRGLASGSGSLDVSLRRFGAETAVSALKRSGGVRLQVTS